jgi:phosphoglycolate phosphatase-like HAD superfamily hydrolase
MRDAVLRLVKDRDRGGPAVPGVNVDLERHRNGGFANMVRTMNDETSWQMLLAALFLFVLLMTPVVMWVLGL